MLYFENILIHCFLGQGAFSVSGKVESGSIQNHDRILVMPAGENGVIKGIVLFVISFPTLINGVFLSSFAADSRLSLPSFRIEN